MGNNKAICCGIGPAAIGCAEAWLEIPLADKLGWLVAPPLQPVKIIAVKINTAVI